MTGLSDKKRQASHFHAAAPKRRVIWLLAGEVSGDIIGAHLMDALHKLDPTLIFVGVGGNHMKTRGLHSLFPMKDLSVMGFWEIVPHYRKIKQRLFQAKQDILLRKPDLILTIDSPSFSARLAESVSKDFKTRLVHYVAPQVWAWGSWRVKSYEKIWHKILCLFSFEPQWFKSTHYKTEWVGHPTANVDQAIHGDPKDFRVRHNIAEKRPVVLFMAGSRMSEIYRLMPQLKKLADNLSHHPSRPVIVMPTSERLGHKLRQMVKSWSHKPIIVWGKRETGGAYSAATCAVTKSGTVTLQLAQAGIPMIITHRVGLVSGLIARHMMKVPFVGIVNLLLGKEVTPEFLQADCNANTLTPAVIRLLDNESVRNRQKEEFKKLKPHLRPSQSEDPSMLAARAVMEVLNAPIPRT